MNMEKHYQKHPRCWYEPSCLRCQVRSFFQLLEFSRTVRHKTRRQ